MFRASTFSLLRIAAALGIIGNLFFLASNALADQRNGTLIITATVPGPFGPANTEGVVGGGGGGGGGWPPSCSGANCVRPPVSELDLDAPAITDVSSVAARTTAEIRWVATDKKGVDECVLVYSQIAPDSPVTRMALSASNNNSYGVFLSGLIARSSYGFSITCFDAAKNGAHAEGRFQTLASDAVPSDVTRLLSIPGDRTVTLLWQYPAGALDIRSFVIRRKIGGSPKDINDGYLAAEITDSSAREYIDTGLENGKQYFYSVFVYNTSGNYSSGKTVAAIPGRLAKRRDTLTGATFWIANGSMPVGLDNGKLYSLAEDAVTVALSESRAPAGAKRVVLVVGKKRYKLNFDAVSRQYKAVILMPPPGSAQAMLLAYAGASPMTLSFNLVSYPRGIIRGSGGELFGDVRVSLLLPDKTIFAADIYNQKNPLYTDREGTYGFIAPNGEYILRVEKAGFRKIERTVTVTRNVLNESFTLTPNTPLEGFIRQIPVWFNVLWRSIAGMTTKAWVVVEKIVRQFIDHPIVKRIAENVAGPIAALATIAFAAPSLIHLLYPLIKHLFFQPLPLMTKRKREGGVVYDSRTKLPMALAHLRLIDAETGATAQTEVTDLNGKYMFLPEAGNYRVVVEKKGYMFPTRVLSMAASDGPRGDLYHGGTVTIAKEGQHLAVNIPVDPIADPPAPSHMAWREQIRHAQNAACLASVTLGAAALIIAPTIDLGRLLLGQMIVYGLFVKFLKPKGRNWGKILDYATKRPVTSAVVRLWSLPDNTLIATQKTRRDGRYGFQAGHNQYFVTVEHPHYESAKSVAFGIKAGEKRLTKENIHLSHRRASAS